MSQVFLPYLYNNQSGQESYSTTLGVARLRQLRLQEGMGQWHRASLAPAGRWHSLGGGNGRVWMQLGAE